MKAQMTARQSKVEMFKVEEDSESNRMTFGMPSQNFDDPTAAEIDHLIESIKMKINQFRGEEEEVLVEKCVFDFKKDLDQY